LDNLALVPASLLPFKEQWQAAANALPTGSVLVYLPCHKKQRNVVRAVASQLREKGTQVRVVDEELQSTTQWPPSANPSP
jgi:hypothetical protein